MGSITIRQYISNLNDGQIIKRDKLLIIRSGESIFYDQQSKSIYDLCSSIVIIGLKVRKRGSYINGTYMVFARWIS
jgi:hypothetical protein